RGSGGVSLSASLFAIAAVSTHSGSSVDGLLVSGGRHDATEVKKRPTTRHVTSRLCICLAAYGTFQSPPRMIRTSKSPAGFVPVLMLSGGMFIRRTRYWTVPGWEP